ncbi:uncharacterized protein BO96DRAFT_466323 [Aspergillus niger CBS 101883]|uniref:Contig An08c0010, genomic contig n=2 Tax=Aspergillus niger TaxID=5061 RepID=A2QPT7_ASPNC|nr:uncharacterized protein BO96DRAFT_466323 [Aspergillus niger CBS 101883]XP_059601119.1 uncharacterized protein An08g00140 [Aspergillus niger]PYH56402.1 hypothetical protein BO96DRAFT_466323 [Aspergillus niger CBS 101883]CAK39772.1 unnamed protein product [Aspergillus niger]
MQVSRELELNTFLKLPLVPRTLAAGGHCSVAGSQNTMARPLSATARCASTVSPTNHQIDDTLGHIVRTRSQCVLGSDFPITSYKPTA